MSKLLGIQNDWNKNKLRLLVFQNEIAENLGKLISQIAIIEFWYGNIVCDPPDFLGDFADNPSVILNTSQSNLIAKPRSMV